MEKILVVAAHPDDEVLGCGGTVVRRVKEGYEVFTLILGEGITSRDEKRDRVKREKEIKKLKKQAFEANYILGVKDVFTHDFPDNNFDSVPILKIIKEIEKIKEIVKPSIVYTHHYGDLNVDHRVVYNAVLTAFRPLKKEIAREIYSFEVFSSTEWAGPDKEIHFIPDTFVDISKTIDKKIEALKCYEKEMQQYPHPRSLKNVKFHAAKRGTESGLKFAESFETIRAVEPERKRS